LVLDNYDFKKRKFVHLPFAGGFMEQSEKNPKLWQAINYILKLLFASGKFG